MNMNIPIFAMLALLFLAVFLQIVWLRRRQLITNYHDAPLQIACASDLTEEIINEIVVHDCDVLYLRVSEEVPLPDVPAGCTHVIVLNVDARGDQNRYCKLLAAIASLPKVLAVQEFENLPA
ncbi:MAG: hypothetical protein IJ744_03670 [Lachnospiraceae bacterium]|nr:hypothetical protein [Lachnospiraceae bacterium]